MTIKSLFTDYLNYLEMKKKPFNKNDRKLRSLSKTLFDYAKINSPSSISNDVVRNYRLHLNRITPPLKKLHKPTI